MKRFKTTLVILISLGFFASASAQAKKRFKGKPIEAGATRLLSPAIDRYRRPYEGTAVTPEAMQAYLDWEFGLVEQLRRDGSHHFRVI